MGVTDANSDKNLNPCKINIRDANMKHLYTRSIMNVSRAQFTHSKQNGTLAESRSEEGSLTGSSAQPDTWRTPHSSPPFQPGTHTDRATTARGEGLRPAVFRSICCVSVQGRDGQGWGATSRRIRFQLNQELRLKKRAGCSPAYLEWSIQIFGDGEIWRYFKPPLKIPSWKSRRLIGEW